ncbi:uncharacterized protein EI90DRAFT_2229838 [Cantharellus anzutake]|uniref:uncharacterized protein n=1 Tax=Cantharellus anzutake TaxID=1750568 RepID=UPI00190844FD|nr:uncharacterized protein EI90DRAFT_2229838 [Cantharellus anzutake]KAF8324779.1 hypothetical protein EI90DRAFT_2229838 [Cantharellus anzutake]
MQDRSNLPHLNTNTRHSLPTPSSPSGSTTMEIPSSKSRSPEVGTMKLPAVALSVPGKSSLASPREWSTFALGGKLKRNASSSGVAETGKERGRSNSSSSRLSPTVESVEAWAEDVAMIDGDRNGARVGEVDGELEEVEEVVKLPPKMRKRAKNGNAGLSLVDSHSSCSTAESSLSPRELDDATLMPPPPLPASMDPTTVSSLSLTFALMAKTEERHLSPVSSHATTPRTPEREMSYEASSMSSERSREPSTSPRVSVEPSLGTVVEDDAMEVEVETDDSGLEPELATVDDSLSTEMEKRESSYRDEKPAASITVEKQLAHSSLTSASSVTVTTPVVEEASAPEVKPKTATSREATPDEAPSLIPWSQPPSSPLPSPAPTLTFSRAPSPPSIRHSSSDATEPTPLGPVVSRSSSSDAAPTFQVPLPDPVAETTSVPPSVPAPASNLKVDSEPAPPAPMPAPLPEEFPAPPPMPTEAPEPVPVPPPVPAPQPSFVPASASAPAFAPVPAPAARMSFADWKKKRALATAVATKQQEDKDKEMQEGRAVETVSIAVAEQGHKENVTTPAVALAPLRAPEVKAASAPVTISTATISREKTEGASAPAIKGGLASGPVPIDVAQRVSR